MSGLLGDVIADLRRNDDPSLLLAMLDLPVAAALGERAEREGMPAGACAARAVDRFCAEADEAAWITLTGLLQSADRPGRAALAYMLSWSLGLGTGATGGTE